MKKMKRLIPVLLLLFLSSPVYADDFQDGLEAYKRKDYKTALEKWKPLAEQGNAGAQGYLGFMYARGWGMPQDYKEAVKWYSKAAEQGHTGAQLDLGSIYQGGRGVQQDYIQAHKWYNLAASGEEGIFGREGLFAKEAGMDRNNLEKQMTPAQIAEAQRLAREWIEKHGKK